MKYVFAFCAALLVAAYLMLPNKLTLEDIRVALVNEEELTPAMWRALQSAASGGNAVAQNNLGVAFLSNPDVAPPIDPTTLFRAAAVEGLAAARYNLALVMPHGPETPVEVIQEQLDLLQGNVSAGDMPSLALLADRLGFDNRAELILVDRDELRLDALRQYAASGDPYDQLLFAKQLIRDGRASDDDALLIEAIPLLLTVHEAGLPRGAESMAAIVERAEGDLAAYLAAENINTDPYHWLTLAGDMGLITAQCQLGINVFAPLQRALNDGDVTPQTRNAMRNTPPERLQRALTDLAACADATGSAFTVNPDLRAPNPPFGALALYLRKVRPAWRSLANSPGWASLLLGGAYLYGVEVEADEERARQYLTLAAETQGFTQAQDILDTLD